MSASLKAFLALVFVAVMGAILIRPIVNSVEAPLVATPEDTPSPARSKKAKPSPPPRPSPSPEPSPTSEGGLISGPFRTQPLFDRYPRECLAAAPAGSTQVALDTGTRVRISQPGVSDAGTLRGRRLLGFSVDGDLAVEHGSGAVSIYDLRQSEPPGRLQRLRSWVWSPHSQCALAIRNGSLLVLGARAEALLAREGVVSAAFSPDGRRLAVVIEEGATTSVWVADLNGTTLREVQRVRTGPRLWLEAWSPSGRTLYLTFGPDSGLSFVTVGSASVPPLGGGVVAAPVTGLEQCGDRLLGVVNEAIASISTRGPDYLTETNAGYTAVSCAPNGSFLAALRDDNLFLLDGNGRELRDLTLDTGFKDVYVDWGSAGAGLLFGRAPADGGAPQVWHIPEGGSARNTGLVFTPGPHALDWAASPPTGLPLP